MKNTNRKQYLYLLVCVLTLLLVSSNNIAFAQSYDSQSTSWIPKYAVPVSKTWTISFSGDVDSSSVNSKNIWVEDSLGNQINVSLKTTGNKVIVSPPVESYKASENYQLNISNAIKSSSGKSLSNGIKMNFSTETKIIKEILKDEVITDFSKDNTISYGSEISVMIPSETINTSEKMSISSLKEYSKPPEFMGETLAFYDVSIGNINNFNKDIAIELPYDPNDIPDGWSAQEALSGLHWNKDNYQWENIPISVDVDKNKATIYTKNLSPVGLTIQKKGIDKVENDKFRVVFNHDNLTYSKEWAGQKEMAETVLSNLTESYDKYVTNNGFKEPNLITKSWVAGGRIVVLLGNYYESSYSPLTGYMYISNIHAMSTAKTDLKHEVSHEFFHAIQNQYFNIYGMAARRWWVEATADYAAAGIMNTRNFETINENYFTRPMYDENNQYKTAHFIEYLVKSKGVNFKSMWDEIADKTLVYDNLKHFIAMNTSDTLPSAYRDFAKHVFLGEDSPVKSKSPYDMGAKSDLSINKDQELTHTFDLPKDGTSKLWGIKVNNLKPSTEKQTIEIKIDEDTGVNTFVDVFLLNSSNRIPGNSLPARTISKADQPVYLDVSDGDTVYILSSNGDSSAKVINATISSKDLTLTVTPEELKAELSKDYKFKIEAKNIPKNLDEVILEWDFADNETKDDGNLSKGSQKVTVVDGLADLEINHKYKKPGDYILQVKLLDKNKNIFGEATANISVDQAKVSISAPRIITYELKSGVDEATHDFEATVTPVGNYRFDWNFDDGSEVKSTNGPSSIISNTYKGIGKYYPKVQVYDQDGLFLGEDSITVILEKANEDDAGCGLPASKYHTLPKEHRDWPGQEIVEIYGTETDGVFQYKYGKYEEYRDGVLRQRGCYADYGKKYGHWEYWNTKAMKYREEHYALGGIKNGVFREWYDNGVKGLEENYDMGKKHGTYQKWYENGNKSQEATYIQDKVHGKAIYYYGDGVKREEINYSNGLREGLSQMWYFTGELKHEEYYELDKPIGQHKYYSTNGNLERVKDYDKRTTTYYDYYDGSITKVENW